MSALPLGYRGEDLDWGLNPGPPALDASTLPLGYRGEDLDWGLNPGPPALDASTLQLGYRGGGKEVHRTLLQSPLDIYILLSPIVSSMGNSCAFKNSETFNNFVFKLFTFIH